MREPTFEGEAASLQRSLAYHASGSRGTTLGHQMTDTNKTFHRDTVIERVRKSQSISSVNTIVENAQRATDNAQIVSADMEAIRHASWRRLGELAGSHSDDDLTRRWFEGLVAFEALKKKRASRTRQMFDRHGARIAFARLVQRTQGTDGFRDMVSAGMHDLTAEWIVLQFSDDFDENVQKIARDRLIEAGIRDLPTPI
jgi:hypothetical protein